MISNFKTQARQHQTKFRTDVLKVGYDTYVTWLNKSDGEKGLNFYNGFNIFDEVRKRYPNYNNGLYADTLRSEHIPFNFFVPFKSDKIFCKNVLNDYLEEKIKSVDVIKIEYAPSPSNKYLNDRTSFDVYIEYTNHNQEKGIIGVEVKYTEKEYPLKENSKEANDICNQSSSYFTVTNNCDIYKPNSTTELLTDKYRQIWRNHILGESILLSHKDEFKYFTSVILFPKGNSHFIETCKDYNELLQRNKSHFLAITYEEFLASCNAYCPNNEFKLWLDYLQRRYIVADRII